MNSQNRQEQQYQFMRNILGYSDQRTRRSLDKIQRIEDATAKVFIPVTLRVGKHEGMFAEISQN